MNGFAPSPTEVTVVSVLTLCGVLATLGLLAGLVIRRRMRGVPVPPVAAKDRRRGLAFLTALGAGMLFLAARIEFVNDETPGRSYTLFELHGTAAPVYWVGFMVGGGLLTLLTGLLLRYRHTLRWVLGPPALLVAALMNVLLFELFRRLDRVDAEWARVRLRTADPTYDAEDVDGFVNPQGGWPLAIAGVLLLTAVVVLVLADRYELVVAMGVSACACLAAVPVMPDSSFWGRRNGQTEHVTYTPFELGGQMLLWPLIFVLLAAVVCAVPFLPKWVRGVVTIAALGAPVYAGLVNVDYSAFNLMLGQRLYNDDFTVATRSLDTPVYVINFVAVFSVPVVAVRGWRAGRRGSVLRPGLPA